MTEKWVAVEGFPSYEVSDAGRVRSIDRTVYNGRGFHSVRGKVLVPFVTPKGYHAVGLYLDRKYHRTLVHRLVYLAFNGPCAGKQVRHWPDRDPAHNTPDNLKVGTNSDNQNDSVKHRTHHCARKTHCKNGHEFDAANTHHYVQARGGPGRACRACRRIRASEKRHVSASLTASA